MTLLRRPKSVAEALSYIGVGGAVPIAGGTDIFPACVDRGPPPELVDLTAIPELRGVTTDQHYIQIGAATRWSDIIRADLPPSFRMLQQAAREIGSVQIQNRATVGGNLCNASPAADGAPPLLALDAAVELVSPRGARTLPIERFLVGNRRTMRSPDEILTAIVIPRTLERANSTFHKLGARRYLVISIVMVAVMIDVDRDRRIADARIVIGAASETAMRLRNLEARLVGRLADASLATCVTSDDLSILKPIDDIRATAAYRLEAARELIGRALVDAAGVRNA